MVSPSHLSLTLLPLPHSGVILLDLSLLGFGDEGVVPLSSMGRDGRHNNATPPVPTRKRSLQTPQLGEEGGGWGAAVRGRPAYLRLTKPLGMCLFGNSLALFYP